MCLNLWIILTPPLPWHLLENLFSAKKLFFQSQQAPTTSCPARVCLDRSEVWLPWGHSTDGPEEERAGRENLSLCPGSDGLWKSSEPRSLDTEPGVGLWQRPPGRGSSSSRCGFQMWGGCLEFWFSWKSLAFKAGPLKVKRVYRGDLELSPIKVTEILALDSVKTRQLWGLQCNVEVWFFIAWRFIEQFMPLQCKCKCYRSHLWVFCSYPETFTKCKIWISFSPHIQPICKSCRFFQDSIPNRVFPAYPPN